MASVPGEEIVAFNLEKPFIDEVDGLLAKYGSSVNVITQRYILPFHGVNSFAYIANILSDRDVIRQELLQAYEDGLQYVESIGFAGNFIVFTPKLL